MAPQFTDISNDAYLARMAIVEAMDGIRVATSSPSVLYRPVIIQDGDKWCCLYGENLQEGVAGFGDTPEAACVAFDHAWYNERTPAAIRAAKVAA